MPTAKERMIEAAEQLFARRGISAVSLREIRAATGQRNTAAVHYHFGSKERLVEAIVDHRMRQIDQRRLAMMEALEGDGRASDLRSLVEATFYPFAASLTPGSCYARFLAQALAEGAYRRVLRVRPQSPHEGIRRVHAQMDRVLRGLPAAVRGQRLLGAWRMWIEVMAEHERELESRRGPELPTAALAADLVDMLVAMLSVPVSPVTRRLMRPRTAGTADVQEISSKRRKGSLPANHRLVGKPERPSTHAA
jgi:AcrR family transcriptional regulator